MQIVSKCQPLAFAAGHVVGAEGYQLFLSSRHMNATALQSIEIDGPCILKSHCRNTKRMALNAVEKTERRLGRTRGTGIAEIPDRRGSRLDVFPMLTDIVPGPICGFLSGNLQRSFILCSSRQCTIFSQHGERRKGAVGCLSPRRDKIFDPQFSSGLILDTGKQIG